MLMSMETGSETDTGTGQILSGALEETVSRFIKAYLIRMSGEGWQKGSDTALPGKI